MTQRMRYHHIYRYTNPDKLLTSNIYLKTKLTTKNVKTNSKDQLQFNLKKIIQQE